MARSAHSLRLHSIVLGGRFVNNTSYSPDASALPGPRARLQRPSRQVVGGHDRQLALVPSRDRSFHRCSPGVKAHVGPSKRSEERQEMHSARRKSRW